MNFNLSTLSTNNYVSSQFSLNKLLNQNNNMVPVGNGTAVGGNPNLAPRFLAMNNGSNSPANQPNTGNANNLVNLGLAPQPSAMNNHCGANSNAAAFSMQHRNSYGLSSTAASSNSSSTSSSLSSSLTNLNYAASAANSLNAAAQNLNNQLNLNNAAVGVGNNNSNVCLNGASQQAGNSQNNTCSVSQQQQQQQLSNSSASLIASVVAAAAAENNPYNNLLANSSLPHMQSTTCSLNNTLFVGNLHASLQEIDLIQVFRPFGHIVECCKKWLHFGFVKFTTEEEACHAYVTLNGFRLKGRPMRLEFQNRTKKARIKAILAQAALQSVTSANGFRNDSLESSLASLNFSNYFPDERQQQHMQQQQHHHQGHQYQHQQQHQHQQQQHVANFLQGNAGNNNCLFSNATTNSLIESLYKSVDSSSTCPNLASGGSQGGPFENSFFNPEQLIKFASNLDGGQKDQQASYASNAAKSHLDFNNLDFFGTTTCNRMNGGGNPFDFGSMDKEKQIRNNLNSIINDKDNECGGGNSLLKPVQGGSLKSSAQQSMAPGATQLNEESLFLHFQMKRTQLSPAISPQHDTSSSLSSDSGCRSTSFLNDEDSGLSSINSIAKVMANHASSLLAVPGQQQQQQQQQLLHNDIKNTKLSMLDDCTLSEHLEFTTCSNSSPVKEKASNKMMMLKSQETADQMVANVLDLENENCIKININDLEVNDLLDVNNERREEQNDDNNNDDDDDLESNTSNDASEMPNDADCLNDLECIDEHFLMNGNEESNSCGAVTNSVAATEYTSNLIEQATTGNNVAVKYNQVVEKDGSLSQMTY